MLVELNRQMLIRLANASNPEIPECDTLVSQGKMRFTGDQHNYDWAWNRSYLNSLSDAALWELCLRYKDGI